LIKHPTIERYGVNNPQAYQDLFESQEGPCPQLKQHGHRFNGTAGGKNRCSVWWVSTHARIQQHYPDESPENVRNYNLGMRQWVDASNTPEDKCGPLNYIDVYNVTARLAMEEPNIAEIMSNDRVHWGLEVNLWKAQIVLNALLSSPP